MSLEERIYGIFSRTQQGTRKAAMFSLEVEEELTHYAQSLGESTIVDDVEGQGEEDKGISNRVLPQRIAHFV